MRRRIVRLLIASYNRRKQNPARHCTTMSLMRPALTTTILGLAASAAIAQPSSSTAQSYPAKPIRIVVPSASGGGTDTIARIVAAGLQERLKQPAVIDNRGGANGVIGTD